MGRVASGTNKDSADWRLSQMDFYIMATVKSFGEFSDDEVLHIKAFASRIGRKERFVRESWIERNEKPLPATKLADGLIFVSMKSFRIWIEEQTGGNDE
jgi:hypothetical protein